MEIFTLLETLEELLEKSKNLPFSTKGIGTFKPVNNANPHIGEKGKLEFVEEEKLEVICNVDKVKSVISVIKKVHPYEEPAIDIVPLIDESYFE